MPSYHDLRRGAGPAPVRPCTAMAGKQLAAAHPVTRLRWAIALRGRQDIGADRHGHDRAPGRL